MSSPESISATEPPVENAPAPRLSLWLAARVLIVRLRFFLVLLAVLLVVGYWHVVRERLQRLTGARNGEPRTANSNTEFWCPMCPGVVSDFPDKCPVCNMTLVARTRGEAAPLPDGVLARMQFSPYRVQLAGIRTAEVAYRPLRREVVLVGVVERSSAAPTVAVQAEVFASELPFLHEKQKVEADADPLPGHVPFAGKIVRFDSASVRMEIDDPRRELRAGMLVTARASAPIMRLPWWRDAVAEEWRTRTTADLALHALFTPALPLLPGGIETLLQESGTQAMLAQAQGAAVPCDAVLDHGSHKVVFVENGPGMFDAVEVTVGPRCDGYFPVLRGVEVGQRVAAAGAFLLDAEMWVNHKAAATYFGATRGGETSSASSTVVRGSLSEKDRELAAKQQICPVTGGALDAMGGPVRVEVAGRVVFVCCKACEKPLRKNPAKYLAKLKAKGSRHEHD